MTKGLNVPSPLSEEEDDVVRATIGCAIEVHRELGPGLLEHFYQRALRLELDAQGIGYETERPIKVMYRGAVLGVQRLDLLVEGAVIVELKSVGHLETLHVVQVLSYLRAARLRAGLLLNFNAAPLSIRRLVL